MRPYQLEPNGLWVDLDTVQSIEPPVCTWCSGWNITLAWWHAFRDLPRARKWEQETVDLNVEEQDRRLRLDIVGHGSYGPMLDANDEPTELVRVRRDVYEPFLKAWKGETLTP